MHRYFVTAIGTDSGKTLVSAILCRALEAVYWKPIQAGHPTDTNTIKKLVPEVNTFEEAYMLEAAMSPHAAADLERRIIDIDKIMLPKYDGNMIVEGAGGLMVPINYELLIIDLIARLNLEVILVSNIYLGNINHTLLSIEALHTRGIKLKGIIFNGENNQATTDIILKRTGCQMIAHIPNLARLDAETIDIWASILKQKLHEHS